MHRTEQLNPWLWTSHKECPRAYTASLCHTTGEKGSAVTNCDVRCYKNLCSDEAYYHNHHRQLLTPAIWWLWVRINDLHYAPSFVKLIAPLSVSPSDFSGHSHYLSRAVSGLLPFLFSWKRACRALRGIRSGQLVFSLHVQTIGELTDVLQLCLNT